MAGLSALGARSAAVWTRAEALRATSAGRVDALVRAGTWRVPWPGVLADGGFDLSPEQRTWAAVLASGGSVVTAAMHEDGRRTGSLTAYACGRTAARIWGLPLVDDDDPATGAHDHDHDDVGVLRNVGGQVLWEGRVLHRHQLRLGPGDLQLRGGLWITAPLRTLADLALLLPHEALVCCLDDALRRALVTPEQLAHAVAQRKGRRNGRVLRNAVAASDGRAEAPSETLLRLLLRPRYPTLEPQVRLLGDRRQVLARFDLGDELARVAVEADGRRGHEGSLMVARDRRRDWAARRRGWVTERFTWFDVRRRQPEVLARVALAYAEQRRALPA